jgi:hypothetical protein
MGASADKPAATWEEIAEAEGITAGAARMTLTRALRKLRRQGLPIFTCRELLEALERGRPHAEHSVRTGRGRR